VTKFNSQIMSRFSLVEFVVNGFAHFHICSIYAFSYLLIFPLTDHVKAAIGVEHGGNFNAFRGLVVFQQGRHNAGQRQGAAI
jgi:hypothetical protein